MAKKYWLFKSEPEVFSLEDLKKSPKMTTCWEGVRNYQARNLLRDEIKVGDGVLFYHSRTKPMSVVGQAKVVRAAYPDPYQFDSKSKYFDSKSTPDSPRWIAVDVQFETEFPTPVTLDELRETAGLESMMLLKKGSRLSIQPVISAEWKIVQRLGSRRRKPQR